MTAKVDFPVPRMPINTMDALASNERRYSLEGRSGVGVSRGVERTLGFVEATVCQPFSAAQGLRYLTHALFANGAFQRRLHVLGNTWYSWCRTATASRAVVGHGCKGPFRPSYNSHIVERVSQRC